MPREYRRMLEHEEEILKMREEGKTKREICEVFGFTMKQMTNFVTRHNSRTRRLAAGIAIKEEGRPPTAYIGSEQAKVAELRYILARKDAKIKSLEMENELMRDFLSHTERK